MRAAHSLQGDISTAIRAGFGRRFGRGFSFLAPQFIDGFDQQENSQMDGIVPRGIPIHGDNRDALMHNKFMIIDSLDVWTGSVNYTYNGLSSDHNDLVHIRSSRLVENYTTEFEEMFLNDLFGADSPANTPNPQLSVDGVLLESYFSPDDSVLDHLVRWSTRPTPASPA